MKLPLRSLAPLAFVLALAPVSASLVACSGATTEQPRTSSSAATKAPLGETTHGPVRIVGAALGDVALRADQRAKLETILKDAEARHATTSGPRKDLVLAFADQVEKGAIDRAALAPKIDAAKAGGQKVRPEDLAALDQVHAILDKEQRAAFVDALEDHVKGAWRGKRGHGKDGHGDKGAAGMWRMKQMAERLQLTDAQKDQIKEKLKALHAAHDKDGGKGEHGKRGRHGGLRQAKQALESFKNDDFKAASLGEALGGGGADKGAAHLTRMVDVAEAVLPVLTPEQRKIAAEELRGFAARGDVPGEH